MKGIKECMTWLFDNEGKWLSNERGESIQFDNEIFDTEYNGGKRTITTTLVIDLLSRNDWQPYKEHYTFDQAKKDCGRTNQRYGAMKDNERINMIIERDSNGTIRLITEGYPNRKDIVGWVIEGFGIAWVKID